MKRQSPSSPQLNLCAPGDEAIEGSVCLRALWLRPQGSVLVEEALADIPPRRDGLWGQPPEPPTRLSLRGHQEPVGHDTPITSGCPNIGCVALQELDRIGSSIITRADVWPEVRRPSRTVKGPEERREALEADVADLRLTNLPDNLQGIKDLTMSFATTLIDSMKAKTHETIVTHVEADLENTPQPPT
jgi:hypothetical protein